MKILVTGASGFVGNAVIKRLSASPKFQPLASTRRLSPTTDWASELSNIDTIIHCAARTHVMREKNPDPLAAYRAVNVEGTQTLAQAAVKAGVQRFVFLSSIKVNGERTPPDTPFTAEDMPNPQDAYGQSKREAEQSLLVVGRDSGMEIVILRPPLVYGQGVKGNFVLLSKLLASGLPLPFGSIHNVRSLVSLDNLLDLIMRCLTHPRAANQVFLVSDGVDLSTPALLQHMARAMDRPCRLFPCPSSLLKSAAYLLGKSGIAQRLCDNLQVDIAKTQATLEWSPPIGIEDAFRRAFAHGG